MLRRRSIDVLCEALGFTPKLSEVDRISESLPAYEVGEKIARFFQGQPRQKLERIFDTIAPSAGADHFVSFLKSNGFLIAVATDSYEYLARRLARKIRADAVLGHTVEMDGDILTGRLLTPHRCLKVKGCRDYSTCKLSFMRELKHADEFTVAVGDSDSDFCVMTEADMPVAYRPRSQSLMQVAKHQVSSFAEIELLLQREIERR